MLLFYFLFLCLPFIFCQTSDFACDGIRNEFIVTDRSNATLFKGNLNFFTVPFNDSKTKLVIKPMEITYNVDNSVYANFSYGASFYYTDYIGCNFQEINNSKCYIFDIGKIVLYGYVWNATLGENVQLLYLYYTFGQGVINIHNGTYIGITTGNIPFQFRTTNYISYSNSKCINFSRLPSVDPMLPKCTQIISDVMFFNVSNNYDVVASANIIFTLDTVMNITGMLRPSTESFSIRVNDWGYSDVNISQNFTQDFSGDSKFKISISSDSLFGYSLANAYIGKIIHRNGIVLMEENRPFTSTDICQDIAPVKSPYKPELLIVPSLCCSSFET